MTPRAWTRSPLPWRVSLGAVVVATSTGEQVLEGSAALAWDLLDGLRTPDELERLGAERFGLSADAVRAALRALAEAELCRSS